MANLIGGIIALAVAVIVLSAVFIQTVKSTNTTSWTSGEVALWGTLSLVAIAGLLYGVASVFGLF